MAETRAAHLRRLGTPGCWCQHELFEYTGRALYRRHGWLRVTTNPDCPYHGERAQSPHRGIPHYDKARGIVGGAELEPPTAKD